MLREDSKESAPKRAHVHAAWWGVVVLFLVHGLVVASWLSRIPAVQNALHLSNGVLGLTLLSSALGAVTTIQISGYLVSRFGSRIVSTLSGVAFCFSVILPALAFNALSLAVALFTYGAMAAAMDVSMNAQGVEVEKQLGRPTMSRFHAMFSLGAMGGAALGGAVAAHGVNPLPHLTAVLAIASTLIREQGHSDAKEHRLPLRRIPKVLLALSAIGFCILLSEGAMADWTAIYLQQILKAGQGVAAAGYSVFSGAMAVFRLLGDLITTRFGPLRTVRGACLIAASGVLLALLAQTPLWSMPGLAIAGMGLSVIIPLVFGSGGHIPGISPGAGIATVTGLGYLGFIVGPPTIGFASQAFTLRYALGFVVLCCLVAAWLAGFMQELEAGDVTPSTVSEQFP
jgi:MFS family permease